MATKKNETKEEQDRAEADRQTPVASLDMTMEGPDKAPYSGTPDVAGNPEGVKSGKRLFEQVRDSFKTDDVPVDAPPALATIREEAADGRATDSIVPNPDYSDAPVSQDTSNKASS